MPKFQDMATWRQAEQLMQPAFIRLVDNLRKQLEQSSWKGTYEDVDVWAEDVSDSTKSRVVQLRSQLETAPEDQVADIEAALAQLPSPYPGYHLHLQKHDRQVTIDLWELCYQICFQNYDSTSNEGLAPEQAADSQKVIIDMSLFDEAGEVDWNQLDHKAQQIVTQLFSSLPGDVAEA